MPAAPATEIDPPRPIRVDPEREAVVLHDFGRGMAARWVNRLKALRPHDGERHELRCQPYPDDEGANEHEPRPAPSLHPCPPFAWQLTNLRASDRYAWRFALPCVARSHRHHETQTRSPANCCVREHDATLTDA